MIICVFALIVSTQTNPCIIPRPQSLDLHPGHFTLASTTQVFSKKAASGVASYLQDWMGIHLGSKTLAVKKHLFNSIEFEMDPLVKGTEAYRLTVNPHQIKICASSPAGAFYGVQSLLQLLPPNALIKTKGKNPSWSIPCLEIRDAPRFGWRGTHLDVARHFMPLPFLYKLVDLLAFHKLNVLHLHLTDDQGWRMEIKRYPKLTLIGSYRKDSQSNDGPDEFEGKPHQGFYTQQQLKDLVGYANRRFVTILPEIEMPGHSQAAVASYPELGNILPGHPNQRVEVSTEYGVHDDILNADDATITFYKHVLDEIMEVFPSKFIHVGGDEAPKGQWKVSQRAQQQIKARGLKDEDELQSWFIRQMDSYLALKHRRLIGWDEILGGGLASGATVMSWRGETGGIAAAKAGHDVVMCPSSWVYLDQLQTKNPRLEINRGWGYLSLERAYRYEPVPMELTAKESSHVLGVQSAVWTELIRDPAQVEYQLFPRLCAFSEVFWSQPGQKDYPDFWLRLQSHMLRLGALKVNAHPQDPIEKDRAGSWQPGFFSQREGTHSWRVEHHLPTGGEYQVSFIYFGGDHGLDISSVELMDGAMILFRDVHESQAGAKSNSSIYRLTVPENLSGRLLSLRVTGHTDGGTDSYGDVRISRVTSYRK